MFCCGQAKGNTARENNVLTNANPGHSFVYLFLFRLESLVFCLSVKSSIAGQFLHTKKEINISYNFVRSKKVFFFIQSPGRCAVSVFGKGKFGCLIVDIAAAVNMVIMETSSNFIKYLALRHLKQFDQQFLIYASELFNQCLPLPL